MGSGRGEFQPCTLEEGVSPPLQRWEKSMVITALLVHIVDVGFDLLVLFLFFCSLQWGFLLGSAVVVLGAWIVSSLYVSMGANVQGSPSFGESGKDRAKRFVLSITQVQIFTEAFRCVFRNGETDYFHTLRLLEALLESAPNALVQLYALILWAGTSDAPASAVPLLRASVLASFASVGLGLAMWEQKVQFRASCRYIAGVALLRAFEVASRSFTFALFAALTHPYGLWWVLLLDYGVMILLIARHRSVHLTYGFFVALPLVLVSLEPLVWRRQDHAVPKDAYYMVRVVELLLMWSLIFRSQEQILLKEETYELWVHGEVLALVSTAGLYVLLPFIWRAAKKHQLNPDDDRDDDQYSDSQLSCMSGSDEEGGCHEEKVIPDGELPPE
mmetsp:Transcript_18459/g.46081  ORF Transcript_18459/g.46081 Transcript_18459/m.46081 type:complete len:387 (+) Transcript_18459:61-1221(+)